MARLNTYIHLVDPEGRACVFGPEDDVPDWAVKAITAPGVWAEQPTGQPYVDGSDTPSEVDAHPAGEPPRSGAGSGKGVWLVYAEQLGLDIPEDATRDQIVAAVDEAKSEQ